MGGHHGQALPYLCVLPRKAQGEGRRAVFPSGSGDFPHPLEDLVVCPIFQYLPYGKRVPVTASSQSFVFINVTNANVAWSPSIQNGATAAVELAGVPLEGVTSFHHVGKFSTGKLSTEGIWSPVVVMLRPESFIKIGRNNPLNVLETNGAFDLQLFGFTADKDWIPFMRPYL